jgi:hypothetical protein
MTSTALDNLVKIGKLKRGAVSQSEFEGLVESGRSRLTDARRSVLSAESRFDLAYNATHAFALAALRWHGCRSENRYLVFQCLEHTLNLKPDQWRVLALCHDRRNAAEYRGIIEVEDRLIEDLIRVAQLVLQRVDALKR